MAKEGVAPRLKIEVGYPMGPLCLAPGLMSKPECALTGSARYWLCFR